MVLHLAGRGGVTISPELRRRIVAKIAKMERLSPKLIEARVVLATERHRHLSEVTLHAKGATLHAEGAAPTSTRRSTRRSPRCPRRSAGRRSA